MSRRGRGAVVWIFVVGGLLAAAALAVHYGAGMLGSDEVAVEGVAVQRGELRISQTVRGNLEAKNSVSLKSEVEGRNSILYLVEEGETVQAGDLVIEREAGEQRTADIAAARAHIEQIQQQESRP